MNKKDWSKSRQYMELNLRIDIEKFLNLLIQNQIMKAQSIIQLQNVYDFPKYASRMEKV
jgi:hypothetical protein